MKPGYSKRGSFMKVRDIMTQTAVCCGPETNVGAAVEMLWIHNYGMLPVVDGNNKLIGIVTDRDFCIALGTRNRLPGNLTVGEVARAPVFTCKPDDDIHEALSTLAEHQVRRLPVVDGNGVPQGVLPWTTSFSMPIKTSGKAAASSPLKKSSEP